ncbi:DUF3306 domain-containing protein [uncultured Ramlibacter sp.]|mgnify:CR=1 FL=1|uniref:DUF3306 domain-containing protein n=1 Tax=uncultured Ramlibacter sp. TaxID=260755 RepID=UPI002613B547|nr:DUF3306 domain-containing protein [uncultured Ramlibacter sp.]
MADGFLGRWSRRKRDAEAGKPLPPEPEPAAQPQAVIPAQAGTQGIAEPETPLPPPPTLDDVKALTPESDFSAFVGRGVDPQVKNAAMKKLFADPHYNIMDGLDTYIDDYSKPDPIPAAWLRQMASAQFLGLFDDEDKDKPQPGDAGEHADTPAAAVMAQSELCNEFPSQPDGPAPSASHTDHADPDLRLQQDNAPPGQGPGGGPR